MSCSCTETDRTLTLTCAGSLRLPSASSFKPRPQRETTTAALLSHTSTERIFPIFTFHCQFLSSFFLQALAVKQPPEPSAFLRLPVVPTRLRLSWLPGDKRAANRRPGCAQQPTVLTVCDHAFEAGRALFGGVHSLFLPHLYRYMLGGDATQDLSLTFTREANRNVQFPSAEL